MIQKDLTYLALAALSESPLPSVCLRRLWKGFKRATDTLIRAIRMMMLIWKVMKLNRFFPSRQGSLWSEIQREIQRIFMQGLTSTIRYAGTMKKYKEPLSVDNQHLYIKIKKLNHTLDSVSQQFNKVHIIKRQNDILILLLNYIVKRVLSR